VKAAKRAGAPPLTLGPLLWKTARPGVGVGVSAGPFYHEASLRALDAGQAAYALACRDEIGRGLLLLHTQPIWHAYTRYLPRDHAPPVWDIEPTDASAPAPPHGGSRCYFRCDVELTEERMRELACLWIGFKGSSVVYVNGAEVGRSRAEPGSAPQTYISLSGKLRPGRNVVAIEAVREAGFVPEAAGLRTHFARLNSGGEAPTSVWGGGPKWWKASPAPAPGWEQPDFDDQDWYQAVVWPQ
jgi:hypothetical protein